MLNLSRIRDEWNSSRGKYIRGYVAILVARGDGTTENRALSREPIRGKTTGEKFDVNVLRNRSAGRGRAREEGEATWTRNGGHLADKAERFRSARKLVGSAVDATSARE